MDKTSINISTLKNALHNRIVKKEFYKNFVLFVFAMFLLSILASAEDTDATYAGKDACKICHLKEYDKIQNSIHQKMIRDASTPGSIHGNLSDPKAPQLSESYNRI